MPNLTLADLESRLVQLETTVDNMWYLICFLVSFVNQLGFSLLESGTVRAKNAKHVLLKNLLVTVITTQLWYLVGWGELYGEGDGFIGTKDFLLLQSKGFPRWCIQLIYILTAITIESGAMIERTRLEPYLIWAVLAAGFVYPTLAHWVWEPDGWLQHIGANGILDTAGGLAVHIFGGTVGLVATTILGPRHGHFSDHAPPGYHSYPLVIAGTWFLILGWCPFNMGGEIFVKPEGSIVAARISLNTLIGGCSSAFSYLILHYIFPSYFRLDGLPNSILAGLSALTSTCAFIEPWAAFPIGCVASMCFIGISKLLEFLRIDDPVDCVAVHLGGGAWGILAIGLFSTQSNVAHYLGRHETAVSHFGAFLGGGGQQLGVQLLGAVVTIGWAVFWSFAVLYPCHLLGVIRVSPDTELSGLDNRSTAGSAYPDFKLR